MGVNKTAAVSKREGPRDKSSGVDWGTVASNTGAVGVTWDEVAPSLVCKLIDLATKRGMGISFSALVSVKSVSITFLDGGERPKFYANTPETLEELVKGLIDKLT